MFKFITKKLVRAGIIAALYAVLTYAFGDLAYGPFQIRPAEALSLLPIFYIEAVPGLYIGCMLANLISGYGIYDIFLGSLITLVASILTFIIGRALKENFLSAILGGIPPILFNAIGIPLIIILVSGDSMALYWTIFGQMMLTQSVWIYALGIPLYFAILKLRKTNTLFRTDYYKKSDADGEKSSEDQTAVEEENG